VVAGVDRLRDFMFDYIQEPRAGDKIINSKDGQRFEWRVKKKCWDI